MSVGKEIAGIFAKNLLIVGHFKKVLKRCLWHQSQVWLNKYGEKIDQTIL